MQMMRRFCRDSFILQKYEKLASTTDNTFDISINDIYQGAKSRRTLKDIENVRSFDMVRVTSRSFRFDNVDIWLTIPALSYPGKSLIIFSQKGNMNACHRLFWVKIL